MDKELKIFAAPLQGFTEAAWRVAHNEVFGGVDAYFTPFIRYEKGGLRNKDSSEVLPENNRGIKVNTSDNGFRTGGIEGFDRFHHFFRL